MSAPIQCSTCHQLKPGPGVLYPSPPPHPARRVCADCDSAHWDSARAISAEPVVTADVTFQVSFTRQQLHEYRVCHGLLHASDDDVVFDLAERVVPVLRGARSTLPESDVTIKLHSALIPADVS